jgi:hypothetical protein
MTRNIEHSYTHILAAFDKVKHARDQIQSIRSLYPRSVVPNDPIDVVDLVLEAQQDLIKVIAGLV